ncbi:hypothetical protein [Humisphaera borealis]|uniref:Lipoprotein n=1 Tax=Humisphaera borealis TaxID=2807512 RepID=A0A7M2X220_9BACT|nr:hypothetical protein [Humisphaera borealis]QOV91735.1 hypothetical protein IPV69_10400 [Humisphaera borealis]
MNRALAFILALSTLPVAGCFDTKSGGSSSGRYDDRYNGSYNSGQPTRYYRESDLVRIGTFQANDKKEKNQLLEIRGKQRFKGILFEVDRGEVIVEKIRVTFEDDSAFEPQTSSRFRDGEQTRLIDLPGNDRDVKRVRVHYRSVSGGSSVITVFGLPAHHR